MKVDLNADYHPSISTRHQYYIQQESRRSRRSAQVVQNSSVHSMVEGDTGLSSRIHHWVGVMSDAEFLETKITIDCHYKWYSTTEICMILDRFDGVVFVGDDMVASIYAAFNTLLRRNIRLGSLEQWRMGDKELEMCACDRQFTNPECMKYWTTSSEEVAKHDSEGGPLSPYACNREYRPTTVQRWSWLTGLQASSTCISLSQAQQIPT
jgi:hypothetical protein